jgi:hypothetical protein
MPGTDLRFDTLFHKSFSARAGQSMNPGHEARVVRLSILGILSSHLVQFLANVIIFLLVGLVQNQGSWHVLVRMCLVVICAYD